MSCFVFKYLDHCRQTRIMSSSSPKTTTKTMVKSSIIPTIANFRPCESTDHRHCFYDDGNLQHHSSFVFRQQSSSSPVNNKIGPCNDDYFKGKQQTNKTQIEKINLPMQNNKLNDSLIAKNNITLASSKKLPSSIMNTVKKADSIPQIAIPQLYLSSASTLRSPRRYDNNPTSSSSQQHYVSNNCPDYDSSVTTTTTHSSMIIIIIFVVGYCFYNH